MTGHLQGTRVTAGNFGRRVILDSNLVCFIFDYLNKNNKLTKQILMRHRLIWSSTLCKCMSEYNRRPKLPDSTILFIDLTSTASAADDISDAILLLGLGEVSHCNHSPKDRSCVSQVCRMGLTIHLNLICSIPCTDPGRGVPENHKL